MAKISKFLRVSPSELRFLWQISYRQNNVFSSPNDVLKSILRRDSKHTADQEKDRKLRIDMEVYEELRRRAEDYHIGLKPLKRLVEKILEDSADEDSTLGARPAPRPGSRPPTK
jgi:hypothetical protein